MYFANFQLSTVRDRWTILQNTYRKSAKWVISEAKGIITSPTEEYYIYKFFVHYNIEKANSNCSSILPLSRPCIKEACLLVNIFQKDSKCSFTFFFHHSIYGVKGSQLSLYIPTMATLLLHIIARSWAISCSKSCSCETIHFEIYAFIAKASL